MVSKKIASKAEKDIVIEKLLERKQPVIHSTFRLSQEGHNAILNLSDSLEVKHAEIFDRLLTIFEALETSKIPVSLTATNEKIERIRKTYVVKKDTLSKLSKLASDKKVTRDLLIERTALAFENLFGVSLSEKKESYRNVLEKIINPFESKATAIGWELDKELGYDHPIAKRFGAVIQVLHMLIGDIEGYIADGTPISHH